MENIGEGYLSGFDLHLDSDECEIVKNALVNHLQFCFSYPELGVKEVLCKSLLRKLGCDLVDVQICKVADL